MLLLGMICLFFTFLHAWRKPKNNVLLAVVSIGFILLPFLTIHILSTLNKTEFISEGVVKFVEIYMVMGQNIKGSEIVQVVTNFFSGKTTGY